MAPETGPKSFGTFEKQATGLFYHEIDLFGLYILFSQYRSCDNTQEVWSFVLFIKMRACKHEYAYMHSS